MIHVFVLVPVMDNLKKNGFKDLRSDPNKLIFNILPFRSTSSICSTSEVEMHYALCMQYFASLDGVVPVMKLHQELGIELLNSRLSICFELEVI